MTTAPILQTVDLKKYYQQGEHTVVFQIKRAFDLQIIFF